MYSIWSTSSTHILEHWNIYQLHLFTSFPRLLSVISFFPPIFSPIFSKLFILNIKHSSKLDFWATGVQTILMKCWNLICAKLSPNWKHFLICREGDSVTVWLCDSNKINIAGICPVKPFIQTNITGLTSDICPPEAARAARQ